MNSLANPVGLLKAVLPRVPMILRILLLRSIYMSPGSGKQDLRTELTVAIIRSFTSVAIPVSKQQKASMRDPGVKGPMWVSKVTLPQPEVDVRDAVLKVVEELGTGSETIDVPDIRAVEAEWTGYRKGVDKNAPQPDISEEEKYKLLLEDSPADMVILYFHGGGHFLMDPCTHRVPVSQLSKYAGAPVLSVRYRLAPQDPFPAAVVDALVAYLSLIHPPAGSLHKPIAANRIVLAGDSAGANLCLALLQTLLTLRRLNHPVHFHSQAIAVVDLPAGVAASSPWCDITLSMPSLRTFARFDYIAPHDQPREDIYTPKVLPDDHIWPTDPPRVDMYTHADASLHPLACPLAAPQHLWSDSPPIFMGIGEEGLTDEALILARKMHRVGVPVFVEQFEGMPHCFGLIMPGTRAGRRFFEGWAGFCRDVVEGKRFTETMVPLAGKIKYLAYKTMAEREISFEMAEEAGLISDEEVEKLLKNARQIRVEGERALREKVKRQGTERARL